MAKLIQDGGKTINYTPSGSDITAGDVVVQGELVGVATQDITDGDLGLLTVAGVFQFAKASGDGGITAGALVYYDVAEGEVKEDDESAANKLAGKTIAAAGDTDTTVLVLLDQ